MQLFQMMDFIFRIPGYVLRFCNNIMGNQYILALLLFAVIVEVLLIPFGIKQQKNSIKQAKLRPKEMAIRKKYAGRDDQPTKQKMSMEIQELYQKEGFNPMGGCLPMLIQFPIIIILYQIVIKPLHYICGLSEDMVNQAIQIVKGYPAYESATFSSGNNINLMGAIKDIMGKDPHAFDTIEGFSDKISSAADLPNLTIFGVDVLDLGVTPGFVDAAGRWLLWVPILTFVVYFLSMKLNRKLSYQPMADDKATGCSNKMMDIVMPLFSVWITFSVPAALGVYWIFKSILGVLKQWILKKAMPLPVFTDEDYKAAEKEMNARMEKAPKAKEPAKAVAAVAKKPTQAEAEEAVRYIFEMSENFRGKLPYWYMYAAHGFARPIIPLVSPEFAKTTRVWYNERNPRPDRMPVQREVFRLLKKQERA